MATIKVRKYTLACGDTVLVHRDAELSALDEQYCRVCKRLQFVVAVSHPLDGWSFRCEGDALNPCGYKRTFGALPLTAEMAALRHATKHKHYVILSLDTDEVEPHVYDKRQASLSDVPPF